MKRSLQFVFLLVLSAPMLVAQETRVSDRGTFAVAAIDSDMFDLSQHRFVAANLRIVPVAAVLEDADAPTDISGLSVFPNPAVSNAVVHFQLNRAQQVVLDVFDLLGRRVGHQDLGVLSAGEHEVNLDLRSLPAGLYIVRLTGDAGARATVRVMRALST